MFGDQSHDFEAEITFLPLGPETRLTPPFNGVCWDFCYAEDMDAQGRQLSMIWPDFIDAAGVSIPKDVPLQGRLRARMHIFVREAVDLHRVRLALGVKFYCTNGGRKIAEGVVTSLNPMAQTKASGLLELPAPEKRVVELQSVGAPYWCIAFEDNDAGCSGMVLHRALDGKTGPVAKLTYWDATGQYWLETLGVELSLAVIDRFVAATKAFVGAPT